MRALDSPLGSIASSHTDLQEAILVAIRFCSCLHPLKTFAESPWIKQKKKQNKKKYVKIRKTPARVGRHHQSHQEHQAAFELREPARRCYCLVNYMFGVCLKETVA